ncbi:hypothetical protein FZEAL_10538 [Fusarium zealandicum]|uniref:Zn(2)-C6 fungal-type domain-containing protein n=1 Tax=Fusarium zealandicum TaxID=1053134 RepID=A0A8H4U081_9HYPO|nr:hypothetical protein FZEAL_10538 [Fusarium zealandicum]
MELDPRLAASSGERASAYTETPTDGHARASPPRHARPSGALISASHGAHDEDDGDGANTPDAPSGFGETPQHHDTDPDGGDPKRPRACEACRGLKVRCEPDPNDEGPCKRCRKAGRSCVVTMPTRKRQKKTDSRVAELEKKIDALTASLQARATPAGGHGHGQAVSGSSTVQPRPSPAETTIPASSYTNATWGYTTSWASSTPMQSAMSVASTAEQAGKMDRASPAQLTATPNTATMAGQKRKFSEGREALEDQRRAEETPAESLASYLDRAKQGDIVERGVLTMEKATEMFARYNDHMIFHLPAVVFPPGFTVAELRRTKPTLFLAIMAAATAESPLLQKVLQKELMLVFAEKLMLAGEKSVELVQALNVAVIWYWPPEHFEDLKFYQLVHMAAVMAIDIGLGQKVKQRRGKVIPESWRQGPPGTTPSRKWSPPDPTSIESRRTWLTCYFLAANTSMALHRPNLVRWNSFMAECVRILQSSPDAAPTDAYFCHLVWTHRLSEEVGIQFALDDQTTHISITELRTQWALRGLEQDLREYSASIPPDMLQPTLKMSFSVLSLYMHEMALHSRTAEPIRPPFSADSLCDGLVNTEKLSAAHINAISTCLIAIDDLLSTFLAMDVFSVRCLPVFNFVRVAYAVVMLIKLYFSASASSSDLGKVLNKEDMHVGRNLDALLDKFRATAADDRCRPAAKFLVVLVMLRSWFYKQAKETKNSSSVPPQQPPTSSVQQSSSQPTLVQNSSSQSSERPSTANTPLQLLSEVATGTGAGAATRNRDSSRASFANWSGIPQPPQPFFHDTAHVQAADGGPSSTMASHLEPLSADLAAAMAPVMPTLLPITAGGVGGYGTSDVQGFNLGPGWDLEGMGMGAGSQGMWEDGMRIFLDEPWFNDVFQGIPGSGNVFSF